MFRLSLFRLVCKYKPSKCSPFAIIISDKFYRPKSLKESTQLGRKSDQQKVWNCELSQKREKKLKFWETIFYISQNFIIARFAAFEWIKLHQIFKPASTSP